jgi:hypothetical protein
MKYFEDARKIYTLILGFRICPSSGILNTRKHNISETGSASIHKRGEGDAYCIGSLRKIFAHSPEDGNTPSFRNVVFSNHLEFRMMGKSLNAAILSVIRQNPLDSTCNSYVQKLSSHLLNNNCCVIIFCNI